jgi:hypothetical protein
MSVWGARIEHVLTDYLVLGGVSACDEVAYFQVGPLLPRHNKAQDGLCARVFGLQIVCTKGRLRCLPDAPSSKIALRKNGIEIEKV